MSLYEYRESQEIMGKGFAAYIMAACRVADDFNTMKLKSVFPGIYNEMKARYNAPGGILEHERKNDDQTKETKN